MGEIRIVGPGKTRGYPYPVCKKILYIQVRMCNKNRLETNFTHACEELFPYYIYIYIYIYI